MSKLLLSFLVVLAASVVSSPAIARRGADDAIGHVRGADHADGHVSGRDRVRVNDDRGRGGDRVRAPDDRGRGGDRVRTADDRGRGGDRVRTEGGRNDRTGDPPRINGEDGGPRQCRGCDPTSGRNR
jgi:hypothetical protein